MDNYERMFIRAAADWRDRIRNANVAAMIDPLSGRIIQSPEVHHISRAKYGELLIPLSEESHQEMTRRQMEEHPPDGPDPDDPIEQMARFLLGAADLMESIVDMMRRVAEFLIAMVAAKPRGA
jgi:hypothetical protein